MRLDDDQLEQLAGLIAERLAHASHLQTPTLLTAPALAAMLDVDVKSVYRHADELGAIRVGRHLRFDPAVALETTTSRPTASAPTPRVVEATSLARTRAKRSETQRNLLPVGRRRAA
jgi:hypothetical protein